MLRQSLLWASRNRWLSRRLPRYRFMQRAVRRFMPGEDAAAALAEAERLRERGITALLTLLGEHVTTEREAEEVAQHYHGVLDTIRDRDLDVQLSVKLTQLGVDVRSRVARTHVRDLAVRAADGGGMVWIDMEASPYVDVTLDIYRRLRSQHANVGVCLQAYLHRTERDLEQLLPLQPAVRLVKGAYAEPKEIAYPRKADVDASYLRLAGRMLEEAGQGGRLRPAFGTHDPRMIAGVQAAAAAARLDRSSYEFQLLYGIGRERQATLAAAGYRVRVLISYGPSWFPWYMRRLAERPANLWFVAKSLVRA